MAKVFRFTRKGVGEMAVSVSDVAKYFLTCVVIETGSLMTHLKLQKLCYYAQAWHMVFQGKPMFPERIEAWAHGPVCPDLWHEYKDYSYGPIPQPERFDCSIFSREERETLNEVWEAYGQFDAKYLEDLTHKEEPWVSAREGYAPGETCTNVISLDRMQRYYVQFLDE